MKIERIAELFGTVSVPAYFIVCALAAAAVFLFIGIKIGGSVASATSRRRLKTERADAVKRSRAVLTGQMAEQISPWLPGFPANPDEARFIGKPVDFIAFCGASSGCVSEVLFIEVKTGSSRLSPVEESLKKAVRDGRVRYVEYRPPG